MSKEELEEKLAKAGIKWEWVNADKYRDKIPLKLYDAMYNYQVEITD